MFFICSIPDIPKMQYVAIIIARNYIIMNLVHVRVICEILMTHDHVCIGKCFFFARTRGLWPMLLAAR